MRAFYLKTPALFARPLRGRARTTHSTRWTRRPLALWAALLLATPLPALAGEFVMGLDLDQSGHEDCSATLSDQNGSQEFTGLDRWIEVIVDSTPPARITSLTVWACDSDTFTTSHYSNTSDWPVAVGAGVGKWVGSWLGRMFRIDASYRARFPASPGCTPTLIVPS